jgi:hypothetical protein
MHCDESAFDGASERICGVKLAAEIIAEQYFQKGRNIRADEI